MFMPLISIFKSSIGMATNRISEQQLGGTEEEREARNRREMLKAAKVRLALLHNSE